MQSKPVGGLPLGVNIDNLLHQAESILTKYPYGRQVLAQLRQCYRPDATLAEAFAGWLGFLTGALGLVILDPSSRAVATLTRPIIERTLFDAAGCQAALAQGRARLLAQGQVETVNTERDVLQVFFTDGKGHRRRLKRAVEGFVIQGGGESFSEGEVRQLLNTQPERFTPSVLLRPLCQDALLPTIAYMAGPTERRYLEQLPALYEWAEIAMPYSVPRPSFNLMDATTADALAEAGGAAALLSDINPWIQLGRSGLPETIKIICDGFRTLEERCYRLAKSIRADLMAMALTESLEKDIAAQLNLLFTALINWNKPRPCKALNCAVAQVSEWLLALCWELKSAQQRGRPPSTWPLIKVARVLGSLAGTLLREGRRQNSLGVAAWKQVGPHMRDQERRMSVAEIVARYGVSIIPGLLSMIHSEGVTRLVTLRETDGW
jgi:hypothetical protein